MYGGLIGTVPGLFVPWTICTIDGLFVPWTVRTVDCSYRPWTFRTLDSSYRGLFVPSWTVRTLLDCSYHGLFVPSLDDSYHAEKDNKPRTWEPTPIMMWMFCLIQTNSIAFAYRYIIFFAQERANFTVYGGRAKKLSRPTQTFGKIQHKSSTADRVHKFVCSLVCALKRLIYNKIL